MDVNFWCLNYLRCECLPHVDPRTPTQCDACDADGIFCSVECHDDWHSRDGLPCDDCGGDHHTEVC